MYGLVYVDSLSPSSQTTFVPIIKEEKAGWLVRLYDRCLVITLNDIVQYNNNNIELLHRLYGLGAWFYVCLEKVVKIM